MAEDTDKYFRCYWCNKALAVEEVVPLMSPKTCGYTASCADCAKDIVERQQQERAAQTAT